MNEKRTFIEFSLILKPEYVELAREVSGPGIGSGANHWIDPALSHPQWTWLQDWAAYPMSNFVPHGFDLEFNCHHPLLIGQEWTVSCALDNEFRTIEYFVEHVVPAIAEKVDWCRTRDRDSSSLTDWELLGGKMVRHVGPLMTHPDLDIGF